MCELDQLGDEGLAVAGAEIHGRDFRQGVATGGQSHAGASGTYHDLSGQSRVVNAHLELEDLVLRGARYTLALHVNAVAHVAE